MRTHGGAADAIASASGSSGLAAALATSSLDGVHRVRASAGVEIAGEGSALARIGFGAPQLAIAGAAEAHDVVIDAIGLPNEASLGAALDGNPHAAAALAAAGPGSAAVLATFGARSDGSESSIALGAVLELDVAFSEALSVSFLDPEVAGGGFDTLRLHIERRGVSLVDQLFDDVSAALAYFDDHVLAFGGDPVPGRLRIAFELTASAGDGFATDFLVQGKPAIVPEPSTAALLLLGLVALTRRRLRYSGTSASTSCARSESDSCHPR